MTESLPRALPSPAGWLVSPDKDFALFFVRDPNSLMRVPIVITQLWYSVKEGIPKKLKNTRKVELESAIETWNELLSHGWEFVDYQVNDEVA